MTLSRFTGKPLKFLLVGVWNTVFGYTSFVVVYDLTSKHGVHYMVALICSQILCLLNAYLCYKYLVFKTAAITLPESLRFVLVYSLNFVANLILLPFCVATLEMTPVVAQGIIVVLTVVASYLGHNFFSFKQTEPLTAE